MTQWIEVDAAANVLVIVEADEPPTARAGAQFFQLSQEVQSWPATPFPRAVLRWTQQSGLHWHDPRTVAEMAVDVRAQRDAMLAATDWWVVRAIELAEPVPSEVSDFRSALRDVPAQPGFPQAVVWPVLANGG